jgi:hypothetical protein
MWYVKLRAMGIIGLRTHPCKAELSAEHLLVKPMAPGFTIHKTFVTDLLCYVAKNFPKKTRTHVAITCQQIFLKFKKKKKKL